MIKHRRNFYKGFPQNLKSNPYWNQTLSGQSALPWNGACSRPVPSQGHV